MNIFKMGLTGKIVSLCLAVAILGSGVVGYGIYVSGKVSEEFGHVAKINLPNAEALGEMLSLQKDTYLYLIFWERAGKTEAAKKEILNKIASYEKIDKWYQEIPFVEGEAALYDRVAESWKAFKAEVEDQINGRGNLDPSNMNRTYIEFDGNLSKLIKFQSEQAKTWSGRAISLSASAVLFQMILLAGLLALSFTFSLVLGRSIAKSVRAFASQISGGADHVHSASDEVSRASGMLSESATEQAASLAQTAASLEEITAMIGKASQGASATASSSAESQSKAEEGSRAVGEMLLSMDDISRSNEAIMSQINVSNQKMAEIVTVIQNIGQKTKVINDIVFQTKLLSFNASVEAARAGEHGKGFAVVAEEVGNLAQMSGNAAKEITEMLDSSMTSVESIVAETKKSVEVLVAQGREKVETGVETAKQCATILGEIVKNVSAVSGLAKEISSASTEQAQGVGEINKAMGQLDTVTQQNAAASEQAARSAQELTTQAESLRGMVSELVLMIDGNSAQRTVPAPEKAPNHSNVVRIGSQKPKTAPAKASYKPAAGESGLPDRHHSGFEDV